MDEKEFGPRPFAARMVFGYKAHVVADANRDVPLGMVVTTASRNDSPFLPSSLSELASGHSWFSLAAVAAGIADRGYDSRSNNGFVHRNGEGSSHSPARVAGRQVA